MSEFISFREIARRLHVARETVAGMVKQGDIPGGFVRYERRGVKRWAVRRILYERWEKIRANSTISANSAI